MHLFIQVWQNLNILVKWSQCPPLKSACAPGRDGASVPPKVSTCSWPVSDELMERCFRCFKSLIEFQFRNVFIPQKRQTLLPVLLKRFLLLYRENRRASDDRRAHKRSRSRPASSSNSLTLPTLSPPCLGSGKPWLGLWVCSYLVPNEPWILFPMTVAPQCRRV